MLTSGQGNAGSVEIIARDNISIDGGNSNNPSNIASMVAFDGIGDAGNINIATNSLSITNGGGIGTQTVGKGNAGLIDIIAENSVILDGINPFEARVRSQIASSVGGQGEGDAGKITIDTDSLSLTNGALINVGIFGKGKDGEKAESGEITINADRSVFMDSSGENNIKSQISSEIGQNGLGNGGNITVNTSNLSLINQGEIVSSTFGTGNSGNITINATESIIIEDGNLINRVEGGSVGNGGKIDINTNNLSVIDGGEITVSTFGNGDSGTVEIDAFESVTIQGRSRSVLINGDINRGVRSKIASSVQNDALGEGGSISITTTDLSISNDGTIIAGTVGRGNAGNININASESVSVDGSNAVEFDSSVILSTSEEDAIGDAGGINITTVNLSIIGNGQIDVSSFGDGNGGDITIQADKATLNNGKISATNTPSQPSSDGVFRIGGNVDFIIAEDIILRDNSLISARASENANGGNVTINADDGFILAFTNQNNDIVANAAEGNGGNIEIFTQAIFGLEERSSTPANLTNDIDASSEFGLQGDIAINTPDFDPTTGLINLPASVGDASDQISQNPCEQGVGSEFIVTGKGGLPPNVNESLNSESAQVGLIETVPSQQQKVTANNIPSDNSIPEAVPAMGWVFNDKGEVTLTAYSNTDTEITRSGQQHRSTCKSGISH